MADNAPPAGRFSLRRWSQRKLAAARTVEALPATAPPAAFASAAAPAAPPATVTATVPSPATPAALPAVDALSFESDFSVFLQPEVDANLRRQALKQLFSDPRFNVMDGLDVYVDDYGRPDPIAPELVRQLVQGRLLFDPPRTRVNAQGQVEEVPLDSEGEVANLDRRRAAAAAAAAVPAVAPASAADAGVASRPLATPAGSAVPIPADRRT